MINWGQVLYTICGKTGYELIRGYVTGGSRDHLPPSKVSSLKQGLKGVVLPGGISFDGVEVRKGLERDMSSQTLIGSTQGGIPFHQRLHTAIAVQRLALPQRYCRLPGLGGMALHKNAFSKSRYCKH